MTTQPKPVLLKEAQQRLEELLRLGRNGSVTIHVRKGHIQNWECHEKGDGDRA